ncbi:MAG: MBL fold metallo-hydrolase [Planctomycetota bacterium]
MRFRFLGTGTSAGVPSIGMDPVSDDPRDVRLRTAAALEFTDPTGQERVLLFDAGPDLRQQALAAGLKRCDGILFTHNHVDHTFGLDEVRRFNVLMDRPIDLYADDRTADHLRRVYQHIFESRQNVQKSFVASVILHRLDVGRPLELFGLKVTPLRLLHGKLPILGFRLEPSSPGLFRSAEAGGILPLAYCTDTSAIPPETWPHLQGLRVLVLDALRRRHHPTHFTLDQALDAAERIGADRTYFVHMNHEMVHAEVESDLPDSVRLAYDGLVLPQ